MSTHTFLCHSHDDARWVEDVARRLEDQCGLSVWLDKWILIPGQMWQQAMARGLEEAKSCAVFIGATTPAGWFEQEIQRALDLQAKNPNFRVIPVLLPDANPALMNAFLQLRTWADFRVGEDHDYAFHVLQQGIKGEPAGRWPVGGSAGAGSRLRQYEQQFKELAHFKKLGVHDEVIIEFERKILDQWFGDRGEK